MRGALREAEKGRRKAEVEAAQLRVEVEAQRRTGDDLQQRRCAAFFPSGRDSANHHSPPKNHPR